MVPAVRKHIVRGKQQAAPLGGDHAALGFQYYIPGYHIPVSATIGSG